MTITEKNQTASTVADQRQLIHNCLEKLVEIKTTLEKIPAPTLPKESVWRAACTGEAWCELRTNITAIYVDFIEKEACHE